MGERRPGLVCVQAETLCALLGRRDPPVEERIGLLPGADQGEGRGVDPQAGRSRRRRRPAGRARQGVPLRRMGGMDPAAARPRRQVAGVRHRRRLRILAEGL